MEVLEQPIHLKINVFFFFIILTFFLPYQTPQAGGLYRLCDNKRLDCFIIFERYEAINF